MDTFEVSLSSFDQSSDAHSFVDFFEQQQQQQHQVTGNTIGNNGSGGGGSSSSSVGGGSSSRVEGESGLVDTSKSPSAGASAGAGASKSSSSASAFGGGGGGESTSPTSALLRSSASPTGRDQFLAQQSDSASTTIDSPISYQNASATAASGKSDNGVATAFVPAASSNSLHPNTATPVRHHSLPFENTNAAGSNSSTTAAATTTTTTSSNRPMAGPSSRQMSMNALSSAQSDTNSPVLNPAMRSSFASGQNSPSGGVIAHDFNNSAFSSPVAQEFLNPHGQVSNSPSPLRTSVPFTSSPDSTSTSPTVMKNEESFAHSSNQSRSPTVPSQPQRANSTSSVGGGGGASAIDQAASTKFVHKLFRMVSDPEYQHLISWNANGTSVVVTNFDEFAKEVLGKHFKHSNFSSFIRQLNMYGFYKVNKTPRGHRHTVDTQVWEFSHPKFIRGRPDLLDDIRRKALDSEHARVEARDLQYSVSVGHMQLRQQVDEQQYRLEEMFEVNMALRQMVLGLRDSLGNVLEWIKANHGGQLPFDARLPVADLPPTPMMHPFMAERPPPPPWGGNMSPNPAAAAAAAAAAAGGASMLGQDHMGGDGPSIFVTEPGFAPQSPHDVFSMSAMQQVSPMASRRVSAGSQASERMDMAHPHGSGPSGISIDTALAAGMASGNPGLGVMGLPSHLNGAEMQMAINTPLPPSPAIPSGPHHHMMNNGNGGASGSTTPYAMDASPFLSASPSMHTFPGQHGSFFATGAVTNHAGAGVHMIASHGGGMPANAMAEDDASMLGPNAKAMRTQIKRTASNSGSHQFALDAAQAVANANQQKRKSPGI